MPEMPASITFVVTYTDGRTSYFDVSRWTLADGGDAAALSVAREKQDDGEIPKGEIATVQRARPLWPLENR